MLVRQLGMLPSQARLEPARAELRQVRLFTQESSGGECDVAAGTGSGGAPQVSVSTLGIAAPSGHVPPQEGPPAPEVVIGVRAEGCSCGSSGESGCTASSSQGAEDETCSGSSSSDYEDDEACSGDSSSSSETDEACSGDSSTEASAGETCAGDGSADVEGDTCAGGGGGGGECALRRGVLPRPRPSVLSVVAAALLLPWRRRTSRRRRRAECRGKVP